MVKLHSERRNKFSLLTSLTGKGKDHKKNDNKSKNNSKNNEKPSNHGLERGSSSLEDAGILNYHHHVHLVTFLLLLFGCVVVCFFVYLLIIFVLI
jgi:hypothetical protein